MFERLEPDSWRDEISCRFWWKLHNACERMTRGKHFFGRLRTDSVVLKRPSRTCLLCRCCQISDTTASVSTCKSAGTTSYRLKFLP